MNDEIKRRLELAAKAAGYTGRVEYSDATGECVFACDMDTAKRTGRTVFAPHTDDGDSRRLEVMLGLTVVQEGAYAIAARWDCPDIVEPYQGDPCAATRIAVLRVAVAIGEAMP